MTDYLDAAKRHKDDAEHLLIDLRLPNADQLFGLSTECAFKAIMLSLGMAMKNGKPVNKNHGHIDVLWNEFISFANGKNHASYVASMGITNPFDDWEVSQRYDNGSVITLQKVQQHKSGADIASKCLNIAILDGIL